jgi:hypothetical protein
MGTFVDPIAHVPTSLSGSQGNFTAVTTNVTLLQANQRRKGATFYNDRSATATWYLVLGPDASATNYTVELRPTDYYEVPYGYLGRIDGVATTTTGSLRVTEVT